MVRRLAAVRRSCPVINTNLNAAIAGIDLQTSSLLLYHYALQRAGKRGALSVHVGDDSSETLCIVQTHYE